MGGFQCRMVRFKAMKTCHSAHVIFISSFGIYCVPFLLESSLSPSSTQKRFVGSYGWPFGSAYCNIQRVVMPPGNQHGTSRRRYSERKTTDVPKVPNRIVQISPCRIGWGIIVTRKKITFINFLSWFHGFVNKPMKVLWF